MGSTLRAATVSALAAFAVAAAPAAAQLPPLPTVTAVPTAVPTVPPVLEQGPDPQAYQANDGRGFRDVLPSGTRGLYSAPDLAAFLATGRTVPHCCEQLGMYSDLLYATPGLQAGDIPKYFKDSSFGVREGDVERRYSPRGDVTIVRDKGFGVPHVYGRDRDGAMFGLGYAAAEDRLFFMDALRNAGRGQLSSFAGGSNTAQDADQWKVAPYTEADLERQTKPPPGFPPALAATIASDADNYIAGINRYITEAKLDPTKLPGEYAAIGRPQGPEPWKRADLVAAASLVGGIFGKGGGEEIAWTQIKHALDARFKRKRARRIFRDFRAAEDPEAPTTVLGRRRFPYQAPPRKLARGSRAIYNRGSLREHEVAAASSGGAAGERERRPQGAARRVALVPEGRLERDARQRARVGERQAADGRRAAGRLLQPADPHGAGRPRTGGGRQARDRRARRVVHRAEPLRPARARARLRVERDVGRPGPDRHLRARALPGRPALPLPRSVRADGGDRARQPLAAHAGRRHPGGHADSARAAHQARARGWLAATVGRKKVVLTRLRSTYFHEIDSAVGFMRFNDPAQIRSAADFQRAASAIGYTFNWFYTDARQIAYFNSGANPARPKGLDPNFPVWGKPRFEWRGFNPDLNTSKLTPFSRHPQVIDQRYLVSWNNKQAKGFRGADSNTFSSAYRSLLLEDRLKALVKGRRKTTLPAMIDAMELAGTTDLRAHVDLAPALRIIGKPKDSSLRRAVDQLRAWQRAGGLRRDANKDKVYEHAAAIRLMDAWWPLWVRAQFRPALGAKAFKAIEAAVQLDNEPNNHGDHLGSAYQTGWYGYVRKDLRTVLKRKVRGRYARKYCGGGRLRRCRQVLRRSLRDAIRAARGDVYGGDEVCADEGRPGDQWCYDAVRQRPVGGATQPLIHWINRPTYQQVTEIQGAAPR